MNEYVEYDGEVVTRTWRTASPVQYGKTVRDQDSVTLTHDVQKIPHRPIAERLPCG